MSSSSYKGAGRAYLRPPRDISNCLTCHNLYLYEDTTLERTVNIDAIDLAECADEGYCKWCSLLHRSLIARGAELPAPGYSAFARIVAQRGKPIYVEWTSQQQERITAEIYQIEGDGPRISELGYARHLPQEITPDFDFNLISTWIQDCDREHTDCVRNSVSTPRRLLDIRDQPNGETSAIRLIQDIQEPAKYIALSHCWGKSQSLNTTTASLQDRLTSITWNDLPKTYQDAITVTRKLGLQYLWIDSLCIIQDDELDWATESSKMSRIYEDSYLTLAVALAQGDDIGFLSTSQERSEYFEAPVDLSDYGINEGTIWVRKIHDNRTLKSQQWLASRAWTLQECLLSRRLLTFSVTISLECRTAQRCECGSGLFPDPFCGDSNLFKKIDRTECAMMLEDSVSDGLVYKYWYHKLIPAYSRRELTKFHDRLPALSGLESKFSLRLNDKYLAGLWKQDLVTGLAWKSDSLGRNLLERAPSWSWASVETEIGFYEGRDRAIKEIALEILDAHVVTNPTGMIQSGRIRVSGMMCKATLSVEPVTAPDPNHSKLKSSLARKGFECKEDVIIDNDDGRFRSVRLDTPLSVATSKTLWRKSVMSLQRSSIEHIQQDQKVSGNVHCVLLYQVSERNVMARVYLILGASLTEAGVYHRLGAAYVRSFDISSIWFGDMKKEEFIIK